MSYRKNFSNYHIFQKRFGFWAVGSTGFRLPPNPPNPQDVDTAERREDRRRRRRRGNTPPTRQRHHHHRRRRRHHGGQFLYSMFFVLRPTPAPIFPPMRLCLLFLFCFSQTEEAKAYKYREGVIKRGSNADFFNFFLTLLLASLVAQLTPQNIDFLEESFLSGEVSDYKHKGWRRETKRGFSLYFLTFKKILLVMNTQEGGERKPHSPSSPCRNVYLKKKNFPTQSLFTGTKGLPTTASILV